MSKQKQKELRNEKQSVCGQSLIATNEDSEQCLRKEVEVLKERIKQFKSQNKTLKAQNELLKAGCGQSLVAINADSEEVDSFKQEIKELKSENQTLRAQNELFKAHKCCDTSLPLRQNKYKRDSMSNKRICLRSYESKKWSFSERICDDLSEIILQFLPIKDKFRFECVSKQFQRTVYRRHYELFVIDYEMTKNMKTFKSISKKLSNIKSLIFSISGPKNKSMIDLIIKNCNQLTQFEGSLSGITEKYKQLFAKRFRLQLTSLKFRDSSYDSILSSFVNIQDIDISYLWEISDEFLSKVKNLKRVSASIPYHLTQFKTCIENNRNITHLSLFFDSTFNNPIDKNLKIISKLSQLISLQLEGSIDLNLLTNDLKQLSLNCHKIKEFSLRFIYWDNNLKTNDFMSEIKKFKELKRMAITVWKSNIEFQDYVINSLKTGFENITHLVINVNPSKYEFFDTFIENIVNYLPKLQNLIIRNRIEVTERTAHILSRLSRLQTLELRISNMSLIDSFKNIIIKNCRKIESIKII